MSHSKVGTRYENADKNEVDDQVQSACPTWEGWSWASCVERMDEEGTMYETGWLVVRL